MIISHLSKDILVETSLRFCNSGHGVIDLHLHDIMTQVTKPTSTYKIAPIWNRLPAEAVNSASVEQFKIELDKVIDTLICCFFFLFFL